MKTITLETNYAMTVGDVKRFGCDMIDNQNHRIIDAKKKYRAVAVRPAGEGSWQIDFEPVVAGSKATA